MTSHIVRLRPNLVIKDGRFIAVANFKHDFHEDSGSGLYSGGLTWSIVLRCDQLTY